MATAGYAPLNDIDEHSIESIPLTNRNRFAENVTPRRPPRSQTSPAVLATAPSASDPPRPRRPAIPVQSTSYHGHEPEKQSERRRSSVQSWKQKIRGLVNPSLHDLPDSNLIAPDTNRPYIHVRQRWRLWRLTIGEFLLTVVLTLSYAMLLYGFARYRTINKIQKERFNALSTGISILLGLNLAGSLRSYAKLLRWRMLAAAYRPLETFDLVLGCDSQINVLRLLWKARNSRFRYLPSRTQIFCVAWLGLNLAMAGVVASIGLTYNLNASNQFVLLNSGEVSVLDISALLSDDYLLDLSRIQSWGITGQTWKQVTWSFDYSNAEPESYQTDLSGDAQYWFVDTSPDGSSGVVSGRYVQASTSCTSYNVTEGKYGNQTYVIYDNGSEKVNQTFLAEPGPGGLSFATSTNSTCGNRCTELIAFQAIPLPRDPTGITIPVVFVCQNFVSQVGDNLGRPIPAYGQISNELARILAGAIGWSGVHITNSPVEYMSYPESSTLGWSLNPGESDMQDLIADFTIGGVAALDDPQVGFERTLVEGTTPSQAEYLDVEWWRAGALLVTIPCVHFVTLFIVIHWANRAIIKDDSHLAAAKLYHSLLTRKNLEDHGCMLKGEEMVEYMGNPMVAYGWAEKGEINHTDVFIQGDGMDTEVRFKEGRYDGIGWPPYKDEEAKVRRSVDARDLF